MIKVINTITRYKSRLYRRQLRRHLQGGLFLRVGDKKIPPGKSAELSEVFEDQVSYLCSLGVLEIESRSGTPDLRMSVIKPPPRPRKRKHQPAKVEPANFIGEDFVIITPKKPKPKPKKEFEIIVPEKTAEKEIEEKVEEPKVTEIIEEKPEVVEETQEGINVELTQDDKIIELMKEMIASGKDLTQSGKPEVWELSERLGFRVSAKKRDELLERS